MSDRLRILYYDDQEVERLRFVRRHRGQFDVEPRETVGDALKDLRDRGNRGLPDLLLLDLYHDVDRSDDDAAQARNVAEANEALADLDIAIQRAKAYVDRAWRPVGIDIAAEIRREFSERELPIGIYSKRGLLLLDDEQARRVEELGAEVILKDPARFSADTEAVAIRRLVRRGKETARLPRDVRLMFWGAAIGLAGSLLTIAAQQLFF